MRWFSVLAVTTVALFMAAPLVAQEAAEAAAEAAGQAEAAAEEAADHAEEAAEHAEAAHAEAAEHAEHAEGAEHDHAAVDFSAKYASYTAAFNAGDVDAVLSHYAEEATGMFEGLPAATGHAEMRPRFEELFAMGAQIELHPIESHANGHMAGDEGHYVLTLQVDGETVTRSGYWMGFLHKHDDGWKFVRLVSNSDHER